MTDGTSKESLIDTDSLLKFLQQNKEINFLISDLQDEKIISQLDFTNFKRKQQEILFQTKAYQRLIRIIPKKNQNVAVLLMQQGIHSALQIAAMTRKDFLELCASLFSNNQNLSATIYQNAHEKRSVILIQYMNILQNGEPHISAARFN